MLRFFNPLCLVFFISPTSFALEAYYGEELAAHESNWSKADLKRLLHEAVANAHVARPGRPDEIVSHCPKARDCIEHRALSYEEARRKMFGQLFLIKTKNSYAVPDIYCERTLSEDEFPEGEGPGPDQIPAAKVVNTEHAWPQSHFTDRYPAAVQKSDLHILFPVLSNANSLRNNYAYGDVVTKIKRVCPASSLGWTSRSNENHFLPPARYRGDVARAVFYFSIRYQASLDSEQEEALRRWHHGDPVDNEEREHQEGILKIQGNRNPFIDHEDWVDYIADF